MNNNIYWGIIIKFQAERTVEIPLINFPPGIVQVNVFNKDKLSLAERLIYVDKLKKNSVKARLNKTKYRPREKVTVSLSADLISRVDYRISPDNIDLLMMISKLKGISYDDLLKDDIAKEYTHYLQDGLSGAIISKKGRFN